MEEQTKNKYLIGILGALLGAFIGSIPWILLYVFGNMIYAILSILIVAGAFYGYKLTKAKIDKKLPIILSIASFIAITATMLLIIPIIYMVKEEVPVSIETIQILYQSEEFVTAISTDYIVSLLFCLVVIGGIVVNLNKQIKQGIPEEDIKIISQNVENDKFSKEDIETARDIFEKNDALSKKHTITKELIVEELEKEFGEEKGKQIFEYLHIEGVIKKKSNKYYFSEKAQKSAYYRYGFSSVKRFIIVMVIAIILACIIIFSQENMKNNIDNNIENTQTINTYNILNTDIYLEFEENMNLLSKEEITYYFGEKFAEVYEAMIADEYLDKIVMVMQTSKDIFEEKYTAKQFLEDTAKAYGNEDAKIEKKEIADYEFYVLNSEYESNDGNIYLEQKYVYDSGENFICITFDNLKENAMQPEKIIK